MANRIQYRRDTAANWTAANPVLALGEPGYETDTKRRKVGDGATAWNSLGYQFDKSSADPIYAGKAVELGRFPSFAPKLPIVLTADAPTITYTDHTAAAPFTTLVLPTDPRLTFHGWVPGTRTISGNSTWINLTNGYQGSTDYAVATNVGTAAPYDIEFDYYGTGLAMNTIGLQATYNWQVYVDGLPVSATPLAMDPSHTGVSYGQYASLTWATAKLRRIRLRIPDFIALKGIRISAADSLSPTKKSAAKAFFLGDSWTAAQGADAAFTGFAFLLGMLTGWEVFRGGQGGTGYVNPGASPSTNFGSTARLNPIADVQPDYLIVAGTSNDDANTANVGAAATALYAAVATRSPKTKIIVVGPQNTSATVSGNREAVRSAIVSAAAAAPNVIGVIDPITAQWITGTGKTTALAGNGNADVFVGPDGAHLVQAGYEYWARRILAALPVAAV